MIYKIIPFFSTVAADFTDFEGRMQIIVPLADVGGRLLQRGSFPFPLSLLDGFSNHHRTGAEDGSAKH